MKPRSSRYGYREAAVKIAAVGAIIVFAALASMPACARDGGSSDSNWERLDRVLVIPPVYKPAAKANAPQASDGCGDSRLGAGPGGAIAVAGTADCQSTNTTQAQEQNSGSSEASDPSQAAANPPTQSAAANTGQTESGNSGPPVGTVGTIDQYRRQQEAQAAVAATIRANRIPRQVVVRPPMVPYYLPRRYAAPAAPPMRHIYVPTTAFPRTSWMPRPAAPVVPASPAWMPRTRVPMVAVRPPMFIPPTAGRFGVTSGFAGMGGWHR